MLFGKDPASASHVTQMIANDQVHKCYVAKVSGRFPQSDAEFTTPAPALTPPEADTATVAPARSTAPDLLAGTAARGDAKEEYSWDGAQLTMHCPVKSSRARAVSRYVVAPPPVMPSRLTLTRYDMCARSGFADVCAHSTAR